MKKAVRPAVMSKQYGHEDFLADLISKACISILPEKSSFNVDNVRVTKILGSGLLQSSVVQVRTRRHISYVTMSSSTNLHAALRAWCSSAR